MSRKLISKDSEWGFTIIELLIATTVLSIILVLVSSMMVGIGRLYFKGINQSRIQNNARSITDEVAQHLQFNDTDPIGPKGPVSKTYGSITIVIWAYCINSTRYTYTLGHQIGTDPSKQQIPHVLWRDTVPSTNCTNGADLTFPNPSSVGGSGGTNGTELIAPNSHLTAFAIDGNAITGTSPYQVTVGVAYGEFDLLQPPGVGIGTRCLGNTGDQFCATASLVTTVGKRL